jgi:hypothetical protein
MMLENNLIDKWILLQNEYDIVCSEMLLHDKTELREKVLELSEQLHSLICEINKLPNNLEIIEKTRILIIKQKRKNES